MRDEQVDALLDRIESDGAVAFDGLRAETTADGYALAVGDADDEGYGSAGSDRNHSVRRDGLSEPEFREIVESEAVEPYVTNWHYWEVEVGDRGRHRRAFLRHAEAAHEHAIPERYEALRDGMETEWGEVVVTATLGEDGRRAYEIRHADDAGRDREELDVHNDPLDAREIATYDDRGRYRPLKSAPSLVSGWVFPDLDGRDAVETLDTFYPATIPNWNLEREGELDVTHWRETAERQTGIYDVIEELPREGVEWIAEACCVDSQCLKRREWEYAEGDELAADGGAGTFPCREPCSLVVAAARKWTKLEAEETRTYEFELTPSEKEQIEAVIDAVADDRIDEIREADVYEGANRYRARYLRAKRFDDDGNLSGTPTRLEEHGEEHEADDDGH